MKKYITESEFFELLNSKHVVPRFQSDGVPRSEDFKVGKAYTVYKLNSTESARVKCSQDSPCVLCLIDSDGNYL